MVFVKPHIDDVIAKCSMKWLGGGRWHRTQACDFGDGCRYPGTLQVARTVWPVWIARAVLVFAPRLAAPLAADHELVLVATWRERQRTCPLAAGRWNSGVASAFQSLNVPATNTDEASGALQRSHCRNPRSG